jgi:hypothetical protein
MTLMMVPHKAERDRVHIWAAVSGTAQRPGELRLEAEQGASATGTAASWNVVDVGGRLPSASRTTWTQTVVLDGLAPGRRHRVRGAVGRDDALCHPGTLPDRLPAANEPPFVILLASCFATFQDKSGEVGTSVAGLPQEHRPHLKLLCGDQVYLDNPWYEILPRSPARLAQRFLDKYLATWIPSGGATGLSQLLAEGSSWFLADDHEFWNNHPNWSPLLASRSSAGRVEWAAIGQTLYESFQALPGQDLRRIQEFKLGPLDVRIVDTRFGRKPGSEEFMHPSEHAALLAWLRTGTSPGVVVLGAPVFTQASGWLSSRFEDRSLANYRQYTELAQALLATRRSILMLTGDVHFGRVARAKGDFVHRAPLVEIAASPLALVNSSVGGKFRAAPSRFPVAAGARARSAVETLQWQEWAGGRDGLCENHFVTLGVRALGRGASVRVTAWKIRNGPASPLGWQEFKLEEGV